MLTLIALIAIVGCKKTPTTINTPIDPALKASFNYQVGTYWIYKDSISGSIDSFYVRVNSPGNGTSSISDEYTYDYIGIGIIIFEYDSNATISKAPSWEFYFSNNKIALTYFDSKLVLGQLESNPLVAFPFQSQSLRFPSDNSTTIAATNTVNLYNTYMVNGVSYSNVSEINSACNILASQNYPLNAPYNYNNWYYLSADVGFVKIILNQPMDSINRIWELQRYKIVKP